MIWALHCGFLWGLAWAGDEPIPPVTEEVASAVVDWTNLEITVTTRSNRTVGAWKDRRVQEQDALDRLGRLIEEAARKIRVRPAIVADDLLSLDDAAQGEEIARRLTDSLSNWRVLETRYSSEGGVELEGVLGLHRWLRPALVDAAHTRPLPPQLDGATGAVIDARGLPFKPCVAPEVRTHDNRLLFGPSRVHQEVIRIKSPVVYVSDPADFSASLRAGEQPLFLIPTEVDQGCILRLSPSDSKRLVRNPVVASLAANGRLVIVVSL